MMSFGGWPLFATIDVCKCCSNFEVILIFSFFNGPHKHTIPSKLAS